MIFIIIEKPHRMNASQNAQTQSFMRSAIGTLTRVPKNVDRRLMESCMPMARARYFVRNHLDKRDSCIVTIKPLPIPNTTCDTIISGNDSTLAATAVSKLPSAIIKLITIVPQTVPNVSMKKPPRMGNTVLMIDTADDRTPYRVFSMWRCCNENVSQNDYSGPKDSFFFFKHASLTEDFIAPKAAPEKCDPTM